MKLLGQTLERMLEVAGPRTAEALGAWDVTFSELVRQVFVQCADRGELLGRVRRAQQHYLAQLVQQVQRLERSDDKSELRKLRAELDEMRGRLGESDQAVRRNTHAGI